MTNPKAESETQNAPEPRPVRKPYAPPAVQHEDSCDVVTLGTRPAQSPGHKPPC